MRAGRLPSQPCRQHRPMSAAPPAVQAVATQIQTALAGATLPAGESDTKGVVVAIPMSQAADTKAACLAALGVKEAVAGRQIWADATITARDWAASFGDAVGCCFASDAFEADDEPDADRRKVLDATLVMATELTDHFELNFSDDVVCAPVLYGGRLNGGSIIGVLGMRVWT